MKCHGRTQGTDFAAGYCKASERTGRADHEGLRRAIDYFCWRAQRCGHLSFRSGTAGRAGLHLRFHRRLQLRQPAQPDPGTQERMGFHGGSEADQGCRPIHEGQECDRGGRHPRHGADAYRAEEVAAGAPTPDTEDRSSARQALATQASARRRLRWLQDSRRICRRLRPGLRGEVSQPRRHLHCAQESRSRVIG